MLAEPWLMSSTAWRRGIEPSGEGSGGQVGPFARLSKMSPRDVSGIRESGDLSVADELAQRRRVRLPEHRGQNVNPRRRELRPKRFRQDEVERLRGAVHGKAGAAGPRRARRHQDDPPVPTLCHETAEMVRRRQDRGAVSGEHCHPHVNRLLQKIRHVWISPGVENQEPNLEVGGHSGKLSACGRLAQIHCHRSRRG